MSAVLLALRLALASVLALAGVAKLADRTGARAAVTGLGIPAALARPIAALLPAAELVGAILLVPAVTARAGAGVALAFLLAFCAAITRSIARGEAPACHCFGALHSEPAGLRTLIRNLLLGAVAAAVLVSGPGTSATAWIARLSGGWTAALALGLALAAALAGATGVALHLRRRQGRLLLHIDALRGALSGAGLPVPDSLSPNPPNAGIAVTGLPVGTPAPAFTLPGLDGVPVALADLHAGGDLLLVFSDPGCAPCAALTPTVASWQREAPGGLRPVLVSRGTAAVNAEHAAEHRLGDVLLQSDREIDERFGVAATPSAVIVAADGRIASPAATGEDAIRALVAGYSGPAEPPLVLPTHRPAATLGVAAPDLPLHTLDGATVSLHALLGGAPRTLVFWNPDCGFCELMLNDLRAIDRLDPAGLIVVSTGSVAANRAMELTAPVLLDRGFTAGQAFAADGTPSAVAIDAEGRVGSPVAVGADAVLALVDAAVPA